MACFVRSSSDCRTPERRSFFSIGTRSSVGLMDLLLAAEELGGAPCVAEALLRRAGASRARRQRLEVEGAHEDVLHALIAECPEVARATACGFGALAREA